MLQIYKSVLIRKERRKGGRKGKTLKNVEQNSAKTEYASVRGKGRTLKFSSWKIFSRKVRSVDFRAVFLESLQTPGHPLFCT